MHNTLVIIPTFNEKENIEAIIREVFKQNKSLSILIVDDNSPDGTATIVKELQIEYSKKLFLEVRKEKNGLGTAYIHGFKWALKRGFDYIIEMDADFSHNPKDIIRLQQECKNNNADLSIGSRYIKGKINVINWDFKRIVLSVGASKYVRLITGIPVYDTTSGFVCYKRKVLEKMDLDAIHFIGYAFQIEMKFKAWKHEFKIKEIPIIFTDRVKGTSKMSSSIITEAIFGVLKMKFRGINS